MRTLTPPHVRAPQRPGSPTSVTSPNSGGRCGSQRGPSAEGTRPSTVVSRSSGAAAAHAWGLEAVGYLTGAWVSCLSQPANTSGRR